MGNILRVKHLRIQEFEGSSPQVGSDDFGSDTGELERGLSTEDPDHISNAEYAMLRLGA